MKKSQTLTVSVKCDILGNDTMKWTPINVDSKENGTNVYLVIIW